MNKKERKKIENILLEAIDNAKVKSFDLDWIRIESFNKIGFKIMPIISIKKFKKLKICQN
jgi:hypothetical protein